MLWVSNRQYENKKMFGQHYNFELNIF